jgi:hypothetical protein
LRQEAGACPGIRAPKSLSAENYRFDQTWLVARNLGKAGEMHLLAWTDEKSPFWRWCIPRNGQVCGTALAGVEPMEMEWDWLRHLGCAEPHLAMKK